MFFKEKNELGEIGYDENIIGNVIRKVINSFNGSVMLSGEKGKIKKNSPKEKNSDNITFMKIHNTESGYILDVFVVLKFGTSIRKTSKELIAMIREDIPKITGLKIYKIRIVITGVRSKNFSKRHITVEG